MKKFFTRKKEAKLDLLEQTLEDVLVPVAPSAKFRETLRKQLRDASTTPQITISNSQATSPEKLTLISLASLFSVLMLAAASIRTVVAILGAIGLANEFSKQLKAKKAQQPLVQTG